METPISIKYLGHASAIISIGGYRLLTDPNFSTQVGISSRKIPLGIDPADLPDFDAVIISNGSLDHFNLSSYKYLPTDIPIIVPGKLGKHIASMLPNPVIELKVWASHHFEGLSITAVPSQPAIGHFWKLIGRRHTSGYLLHYKNDYLYFAGNAGAGTHFSEIGNLYPLTAALLPIGQPLIPRVKSCGGLTIPESIVAIRALKCRWMIPLNLTTFSINQMALFQPMQLLKEAATEQVDSRILIIPEGKERTVSAV